MEYLTPKDTSAAQLWHVWLERTFWIKEQEDFRSQNTRFSASLGKNNTNNILMMPVSIGMPTGRGKTAQGSAPRTENYKQLMTTVRWRTSLPQE